MRDNAPKVIIAFVVAAPFMAFMYIHTFGDGDVGPFFGDKTNPPTSTPDQVFALSDRFVLESYDSNAIRQKPVVALREIASQKIYWCIIVNDDSTETKIRFESRLPFTERTKSSIFYSSGPARAIWVIGEAGEFRGYTVWT